VNSGSVGRIAEQIGQTVIEQGWNSYITYARNHLPSVSKTIKIGNKFNIYWHGINTRLFDNHCLCSTGATKKLIKQIEQAKPDIIQLHHIHGYYLNMKILFEYLTAINIPVVWVFHDCWSFTGHCCYFEYIGCEKWKTGCYRCPQKNKYPASRFLDRSQKNYELKRRLFNNIKNMTIVPVSHWLEKQIRNSFLNKYSIHIIQNGVDIGIFCPVEDTDSIRNKYDIENKFIILGVAGIWEERKGLNDFVALNNTIDHDLFKIVLVGLSKKQIQKIPKEITGIEHTENINELVALYSVADVFMNPTLEDTFPTTNIESLACGTPVITYRTGGSIESVSDNVGMIVEKGDVEGLNKSLLKVKEKGKKYYTDNCRNRAIAYYNREERYKDYLSLYDRLLKN
jgi:glycosyltransferase involved in cell wall biosynthesis